MTGTLTLPAARAADAVARIHERLRRHGVELPVRLWDGRELGPDDLGFRLLVREPWAVRAAMLPPNDLRAGETYLAGGFDVEGSMVAALRCVSQLDTALPVRERLRLLGHLARLPQPPESLGRGRVQLRGRRHAMERDAAAISHHYDVGNDFYRLLLDPDLVYSCGYFAESDRHAATLEPEALARAQRRKLEVICRKLDLQPGERFLDVGCGWGSLVIHAAREHGVQALGVTLSEQQAALAQERIAAAGLDDRVRVELRDYRDVQERFDAIASVGMVEHVGADQLPRYVRHLRELLVDGGRLLNHGITTGGRDTVRDLGADPDTFIGRYVFPDGALVPAHHMIRLIEQGGLELLDVEQLRPHYARTLQHWVANLEAAYDDAVALVGEATVRVWRAYLAGSVLGFEHDDLGVIQILAGRGDTSLPWGRERMVGLEDRPRGARVT